MIQRRLLFLLVMMFTMVFAYGQENDAKIDAANKLLEEGVALHDKGQYQEAIKKYDEALKILPNNSNLLYEKAYSVYAMGNSAEAKKLLEKLFKKANAEDYLPSAFLFYANLLDDGGEPFKALEVYDKGIDLANEDDYDNLQMLHYNKALTISRLSDENKAKVEHWDRQVEYNLEQSIEYKPAHPGSHFLMGNTMEKFGGYYRAIAHYALNSFLVGKKVDNLEPALNGWANLELSEDSGPLTTLSLNKVKEVLKTEPSEYGRLYDIFTTVIPLVAPDTLGQPVTLAYADNKVTDAIMPFFAELNRKGLLECFFHEAMKNADKQYISNANWLVEHKADVDRLYATIKETKLFWEDLKHGFYRDSIDFTTPEETSKHIYDVMGCCRFVLTRVSDAKSMPDAVKYLTQWVTLSPDVHLMIGENVAKWAQANPHYLAVYLAGCTFYALSSHTKTWDKQTFAEGVYNVIKTYSYDKEKNGVNEDLEAIVKMYQADDDSYKNYIEENYNK